jgi:hypothetical protein
MPGVRLVFRLWSLQPGKREIYGMYVETAGITEVRPRRWMPGLSVPEVALVQSHSREIYGIYVKKAALRERGDRGDSQGGPRQ